MGAMVGVEISVEGLLRIPKELQVLKQWVLVRIERINGKPTKVPYCVETLKRASATNPETWSSFTAALRAFDSKQRSYTTIGFVCTESDPYTFVDLDHVLDGFNFTIPEAEEAFRCLNSFTEISLSGSGLHIMVRAKKPANNCRSFSVNWLEIYEKERFVAMTGEALKEGYDEIHDSQAELTNLYNRYDNSRNHTILPTRHQAILPPCKDADVIKACLAERTADKLKRLWEGNISDYDSDQSRADFAFCSMLARHTSDPVQIDRLFRKSKLMREKWDSHRGDKTYGSLTIQKAIASHSEAFQTQIAVCPTIVVNDKQSSQLIRETIDLLQDTITRPLFVRAGTLCEILLNDDNPVIVEHSPDSLRALMSISANWVQSNASGSSPINPPKQIAQMILALRQWNFPRLTGIATSPFIRIDGSVVYSEGYDFVSKRYLTLRGLDSFPPVSEYPSELEVIEARKLLEELVSDFPFADQASKANTLALMILPSVLSVIDAPTPIALTDAAENGAGKTLINNCCVRIYTGGEPTLASPPTKEEEWEKLIFSFLIAGSPFIIFDNADRRICSKTLASVLTSPLFTSRILGKSIIESYPNKAVWMLNGKNLDISTEIARRSYWIRLVSRIEKPHERAGFLHPNLSEWIDDNRAQLLHAILTLGRAWFAAGCPKPCIRPLGGFQRWANVVGGILENAGIHGFMSNSDDLWDEVNTESSSWQKFLEIWFELFGSTVKTTKEVMEIVAQEPSSPFDGYLPEQILLALSTTSDKSKLSRFGKALREQRDRRFGSNGLYLNKPIKRESRGATWQVLCENERQDPQNTALLVPSASDDFACPECFNTPSKVS